MNLDSLRALKLAANEPRLRQLTELLLDGQYAEGDAHAATPEFSRSLAGLELRCLALFSSARLHDAVAAAELLLTRTLAEAGPAAAGPARRTLAERLWNVDLRQSYPRVRSLLHPLDDPKDLDEVERYRRRIILADFAQCRGEYDLAGSCLREAGQLIGAVSDEAESLACQVDYELANCRSLQGRGLLDEALASIERGLEAARRTRNVAGEIRLLIRRARTLFMRTDQAAGEHALADAGQLFAATEQRPVGVVCWAEVRSEVMFTRGELALYARRPVSAERYIRSAAEVAQRIGSMEGYVEASVVLTAALLMQDRADDAMRQYHTARRLCADSCYADLTSDLDKLTESKRFITLSRLVRDSQREGATR
ncbi:hypothetical protein ACWDV4_18010 [Micromonospora sp. NPDC003197]